MKRKELSNRAIGYIVVIISIILVLSFFSFGYTDLINGEITDIRIVELSQYSSENASNREVVISAAQKEEIKENLEKLRGFSVKPSVKMDFKETHTYVAFFDVLTEKGIIGANIVFSNTSTHIFVNSSVISETFKLKRFITQKQHNKILNEIFKDVLVLE